MRNLRDYKEQQLPPEKIERLKNVFKSPKFPNYALLPSEIRHAVADIPKRVTTIPNNTPFVEYNEFRGLGGLIIEADYQPQGLTSFTPHLNNRYNINRVRCTSFSSVRLIQWSTGAHYKYKDLCLMYEIKGDGIFCGDGSGGIGANHLRKNQHARVIFNSKLDLEGDSWKGLAPAGPGAYTVSGEGVIRRCVNYDTCWEEPSDLSIRDTWENFLRLIKLHDMKIEIICCDAEIFDFDVTNALEELLLEYCGKIFTQFGGMLIYKTYWARLLDNQTITHRLSQYFLKVSIAIPQCQGSFTSEIYVVAQQLKVPEVPLRTELTLATLEMIHQSLKVTQTYESEFNRLYELDYMSAIQGMETRVPFTRLEDIAILFTTIGVETGLALSMAEQICIEIKKGLHPYSLMLYIGFMVSRSLLPITCWYKKHRKMPSSNKLQKMIAVIFGLWYGVVYLTKDLVSFTTISNFYQSEIPIQVFRSHMVYRTKKTKHGNVKVTKKPLGRIMSWRFCKGDQAKVIDPGPRAGITQQVTRMFIILYQGQVTERPFKKSDTDQCNKMLQSFDKIATVRKVLERTGIDFSKLMQAPQNQTPVTLLPDIGDEGGDMMAYEELD